MGNSLNQDLRGKTVILDSSRYKGNEEERKFKCENGFGCSPVTNGKAIFGHFLTDNEKARISGYDVEKIV